MWRQVRDYRDGYVAAATKIEQDFALRTVEFDAEKSADIETFPAVERALMRHVEGQLLNGAGPDVLDLAQSRLSRFWADVNPMIQAHWALIAASAQVLLEADRIAKELKNAAYKRFKQGPAPIARRTNVAV
jgi:hypothetical protein